MFTTRALSFKLALLTLATVFVAAMITVSPAQAKQSPREIFDEVCELAGGTPKRDWQTGRLICTFPDGSTVWCTPGLGRCGHTKVKVNRGIGTSPGVQSHVPQPVASTR